MSRLFIRQNRARIDGDSIITIVTYRHLTNISDLFVGSHEEIHTRKIQKKFGKILSIDSSPKVDCGNVGQKISQKMTSRHFQKQSWIFYRQTIEIYQFKLLFDSMFRLMFGKSSATSTGQISKAQDNSTAFLFTSSIRNSIMFTMSLDKRIRSKKTNSETTKINQCICLGIIRQFVNNYRINVPAKITLYKST